MTKTISDIINKFWPVVVIVVSILIIMRVTYIVKSDRRSFKLHEEIFNLLFIVYLLLLFQLVSSQELTGGGTNYIPFREILRYEYGTAGFYKQVVGNILLFIPLGYFATSYCRIKGLGGITILSLLSSLSIELVQKFIGRSFDIDDIILNIVGGIIGFLLYTALTAIKNHLPKFLSSNWFLNILSIVVLVLLGMYVYRIV